MTEVDVARHWRHPSAPSVDLMTARFVRHEFARHSHPFLAIGVIEAGAERISIGGDVRTVGAGGVIVVNAETVHSGGAAHPKGWAYRVFYPPVALVAEVAAELGAVRGTPSFGTPVSRDPALARAIAAAHRAAEGPDPLAASSLLHHALGLTWRAHGDGRRAAAWPRPGSERLTRARDLLMDGMADPPTLDELAREVGLGRFALLKGFRDGFGLPPHAYLNQQRVRRSQDLLAAGMPVGEVAVRVGFADQAHLSRHFRRTVGVPPGRWSRERLRQ